MYVVHIAHATSSKRELGAERTRSLAMSGLIRTDSTASCTTATRMHAMREAAMNKALCASNTPQCTATRANSALET